MVWCFISFHGNIEMQFDYLPIYYSSDCKLHLLLECWYFSQKKRNHIDPFFYMALKRLFGMLCCSLMWLKYLSLLGLHIQILYCGLMGQVCLPTLIFVCLACFQEPLHGGGIGCLSALICWTQIWQSTISYWYKLTQLLFNVSYFVTHRPAPCTQFSSWVTKPSPIPNKR